MKKVNMGVTIDIRYKDFGNYIVMSKIEWRKLLAWLADGKSPITNKSLPVIK